MTSDDQLTTVRVNIGDITSRPFVFAATGGGEWIVEVIREAGFYEQSTVLDREVTTSYSPSRAELVVRATYNVGGGFQVVAGEERIEWTGDSVCRFVFVTPAGTLQLTVFPDADPVFFPTPVRPESPPTKDELMIAYNAAGALLDEDFSI